MVLQWVLGALVLLVAASPLSAATLRVRLIPEVSDEKVWRFEVANDSVDILDVQRLTAIFLTDGHRLWSQPAVLTPSLLRPGEAGWVTLDATLIPKQSPLRIDWEMTWTPHSVPVLPRLWRTERTASLEIQRVSPSTPASATPKPQTLRPIPDAPLWRF